MGSLSIIHWLIVLAIMFGVFGVPVLRIIQNAGFSGWWVILAFIPIANWVGLWIFAFSRWPALAPSASSR